MTTEETMLPATANGPVPEAQETVSQATETPQIGSLKPQARNRDSAISLESPIITILSSTGAITPEETLAELSVATSEAAVGVPVVKAAEVTSPPPADLPIDNNASTTVEVHEVPVAAPIEPTVEVPAPVEPATEVPAPVEPVAEVPAPIEPTIEVPAPVELVTEAPAPVEPATEVPAPVGPVAEVPAPVELVAEVLAPVEPVTEAPAPVEPATEVPATVEPTVEVPAPVEPIVEVSAPVEPVAEVPAPVEPATEVPAPAEVAAETPAPVEVTPEVPAPAEVSAEITEIPVLVEAAAEVPATVEVAASGQVEETPEIPAEVATPVEVSTETSTETPAPVEAAAEVPAPVEATPSVPAVETPAEVPQPVAETKIAETPAPKPPKVIGGSEDVVGDKDTWIFHKDFENDLLGVPGLTEQARREVLTTAWEYSRVIIPQYSNWERFSCWVRFMIIGILAEYEGTVLDVANSDKVLGYDLEHLLSTMLRNRPGAEDMKREYRAFLLMSSDKCSDRRDGALFRRYVDHLARGPKIWFRARDCDALGRFTIAAALCSNDVDDIWWNEEQLNILGEIGVCLYDAVAFFKHRSEGETSNTFAYINPRHRAETYKRYREVLWAFDAAWGSDPRKLIAINFIRPFGGPLHMMMRRYRYVEDGMLIGNEEDEVTVQQTRQHYKLWHRVDLREDYDPQEERYQRIIAQKERLLYPGLAEALESEDKTERCGKCVFRTTYGTINIGEFGGVKLCEECEDKYNAFGESLPARAAAAFPELLTHSQLRLKY